MTPMFPNVTSAPATVKNRSSLPPAFQSVGGLPPPPTSRPFSHGYTASPLHKALTPPPFETQRSRDNDLEPFPSIESSIDSTSSASLKNFSLSGGEPSSRPGLYPSVSQRQHHRFSNPTPSSFRSREVQIYCSNCKRTWPLVDCYACTECICGVCRECVNMFMSSPPLSFLSVTSSPGNGAAGNRNAMPHGPTSYPAPRGCPRCRTVGGKWKQFQLDFK